VSRSPDLPPWLHFLEIGFPSANLIVTGEGQRVLFDPGYGSDLARTTAALTEAGIDASGLDLIVNTHWHSDHVGGNAGLQSRYGIPVAAARSDAEAVNACRPDACLSEWLDQPVEQYLVARVLEPGDEVVAGHAAWQVLATPGHTPSHLSFYQPEEEVVVLGDAVHANDVGWINLALDGVAAIDAALQTVETLAQLPVRVALPGHGPAIGDPPAAFGSAHSRYERMRADPQRAGWHACKRIFAFALMIHDGIPMKDVRAYLGGQPWLIDFATTVFNTTADVFAADLLSEMNRSGATEERDGRLVCRTPHHRPAPGWLRSPGFPREWRWLGPPG
jgi:hydroxyacylglutathione hydrolase